MPKLVTMIGRQIAMPAAALLSLAPASANAAAIERHAAVIGPHAAQCGGREPAMLVRVIGLKDRSGIVRVQSYGGDPETFLDKGRYLERIDLAPPQHGAVDVCVPVPRAGTYAVSVRHKTPGDNAMDDGGGVSGNPRRSLLDLAFKRKPDPARIAVKVAGVVTVPVVMNYVQGGSFSPIRTAER